ncbi:hypothetical protein [Pedobacter heparinus]|uniref:Uncharacterized protein n=1 Tax=Pedobacter heparinus (strain ATCC 13125 / DSM 2366 / CIP 104194 / JCM 7457 / NBRC 12017 / NCIMB 9290 / NRRL B-14731 / HIM 762-3) TaxID=485917 RepID=C6Y3I7_PEDHD|nr:hypothetical protein [Pedobacter heparinus]ACU03266.1 hypothetical protein Phep_1046 [Pedobacter heparinus DSM 2366]
MKFISICIVLTGLSVATAYAQHKLPEVPAVHIKSCNIKGTYVPRDDFQKKFPDFNQDGRYVFDKADVIPSPMGLDYDGYFFLDRFDQKEFPAFFANSNNTLNGFNRIIVQFTPRESGVQFHLDRENYIYNRFDIEYPELYNLKSNSRAAYDKMNALYKSEVRKVLEKKGAVKVVFSDLANSAYDTDSLFYDDLVLDFQYVQSNTWMQAKTAAKFPSHSLYQLVVKDVSGKVLKTYGQAIFFEGEHGKMSRPKLTEHFVFATTFPVALTSLVNQFLNDETLCNEIKSANALSQKNISSNQVYANLLRLRSGYNLIKAKKAELVNISLNLGVKLIEIEGGIAGVKQANEQQNAINSLTGSDVSGAIGGLFTNMILKAGQNKNMGRINRITTMLQKRAEDLKNEENIFLSQVSQYLIHPSDLEMLLQDKNEMDTRLDAILDRTVSDKATVSNSLNETYRSLNQTFISNINTGLQFAIQNNTATAGSQASGGSNNNSAQIGGADACSKVSESEWKSSPEYKKCSSQTVVNTSQASCERAKAKLIEITLKNCRSKLPANEIKQLEQTRQQLLQRAAQMDSGAFRM